MIGVYFSGTGNTKYCLEKFVALYDGTSEIVSLEEKSVIEKIILHKDIVFAYPIYYSNLPKIVRDFINDNHTIWEKKNIFIIATMGLFSGDGAGLSARLFKKYKAHIWGGLHLKMPDCICDVKALKHSTAQNQQIISDVNEAIPLAVNKLKQGIPTQNGLGFLSHIAGLLGQRLWFIGKTRHYYENVHIDKAACIGCGSCVSICPMQNFSLIQEKAVAGKKCTLCYRCANQCKRTEVRVPIHLKITLTIREAAEYSNIGINKIDSMLKQPNCPFVLYVGTRKLVKRKEFEEYIRRELII